jgi:hypothetical protein
MFQEVVRLLLNIGIPMGVVILVIWGLVFYWFIQDRRQKKALAEAEICEEELTVETCSSTWETNAPVPPGSSPSREMVMDLSRNSGKVPSRGWAPFALPPSEPTGRALAWYGFYLDIMHFQEHPEDLREWYDNRFTTSEYPDLSIRFCADKALEHGDKVQVKLWKHARTNRIVKAEVLRKAA